MSAPRAASTHFVGQITQGKLLHLKALGDFGGILGKYKFTLVTSSTAVSLSLICLGTNSLLTRLSVLFICISILEEVVHVLKAHVCIFYNKILTNYIRWLSHVFHKVLII